jgi:superfamily II DNA or RNA helicase
MLVIYDDLEHGEHLQKLYEEQGFETRLAEGKTSTKNRSSAIEWFEPDCEPGQWGKVLLASKVFDEGIDIKGGCDIFYAIGAGKDISKVTQRLGRALRKNRSGRLRCFDNQDSNHPTLSRWSGIRRSAIEELKIPVKTITLEEFVALSSSPA